MGTAPKRSVAKEAVNWSKCDTCLLVFAFILAGIAATCAALLLPRRWPEVDDDVEPNYVMTMCTIQQVELTGQLVACTRNGRGEWCEVIREKRQAPHGGGDHRGREFPCLSVSVDVDPAPLGEHWGHRGRGRHGQPAQHHQQESSEEEEEDAFAAFLLHDDFIEAENFPQCTMSSCDQWWIDNEEAVQEQVAEFERLLNAGITVPCFVDVNHPDSNVALSNPPGWQMVFKSRAFHSFLWCGIASIFLIVLILVRRCRFAAKTMYHEQHKVDPETSQTANEKRSPFTVSDGELTSRRGNSMVSLSSLPEKQPLPDVAGDTAIPAALYLLAGPPPAYDSPGDAEQLTSGERPFSAPPPYEIIVRPYANASDGQIENATAPEPSTEDLK